MTRFYRSVLGLILAMAFIALSGTTLAAQTAATTTDNATAVALQKMQEQLDQQQQQIHRLQSQLLEARQQLNSVSNSSSSEGTLVNASYSGSSLSAADAAAVSSLPQGPPPAPAVIPAIAPVRTLPVDSPKTGGLIPGIKLGPVSMTPYGFIKATVVHDSSDPDGDDFPFYGLFLNSNLVNSTGATLDPAVHVKARATRFGANFEWPDVSPKLTLTGRIEGDFEGNFNEADNSDVTSIRSPNPRLRLAFVRMDYHLSENTSVYLEGGQDWTLFGSGVLPNLVETTSNAAYYGAVFGRSPQLRGGWVQSLSPWHNLKLSFEGGIMMPSTGDIEKLGSFSGTPGGGLAVQIGQGEREGGDANRPEAEARLTLQFQLDPAKGVAPAQIMLSGFHSRRQYVVTPDAASGTTLYNNELAAVQANPLSSPMYGGQIGVQLPTRWATLSASLYRGADLRFYAAGQIQTFATVNCPAGTVTHILTTADSNLAAEGPAAVCVNPATDAVTVAPEVPIRAFGGFAQVGFPLSRIFNADPKGHNAGWQLYLATGKDQVVRRDLTNPNFSNSTGNLSPLPTFMGKFAALTLYYKLNQWASFGFEQSIYADRLSGNIGNNLYGAFNYVIAGVPSKEWQDHRTELGPIFTF